MSNYDFIEIRSGLYNMSRLVAVLPLTAKKITDGKYSYAQQAELVEALGKYAGFFDFRYDPDSRMYYAKLLEDPGEQMPRIPVYALYFDNIRVYANGDSVRKFFDRLTIATC